MAILILILTFIGLRELIKMARSQPKPTYGSRYTHRYDNRASYYVRLTDTSRRANIDYLNGHDFEYWCADLLIRCGFTNVEVTPGSNDQGVDILAMKDGYTYAIQCKRYSKPVGNKPVQEVNAGRIIYDCDYAVVMTNQYFTDSAIEAANATGVELWDRDDIFAFLAAVE